MTKRFMGRQRPLLALGTIAASGLVLSACGDAPAEDTIYSTPAQCIDAGIDDEICTAEYQEALQAHLKNAPKFDGRAACEAEYGAGKCLETPASAGTQGSGSGGFFMPFMTGYLVSSAISSLSDYGAYRRYRERDTYYYPGPIYTNRSGVSYRSDPPAIGQPPRQRPVNVNTRTVSRQGFGGMASNRGSSFGG